MWQASPGEVGVSFGVYGYKGTWVWPGYEASGGCGLGTRLAGVGLMNRVPSLQEALLKLLGGEVFESHAAKLQQLKMCEDSLYEL